MDWMHVYIVGAAVLVFALVGLVLLVSSQHIKVANTGAGPYLKFIWANFIKPHDKKAGGQQDALESFYKTQVRSNDQELGYGSKLTVSVRPQFTMPLVAVCSVVVRTCLVLWLHS